MEKPLYIKSAVGGVGLKCHREEKRASGCVSHLESKQRYQNDSLDALTLYSFTLRPQVLHQIFFRYFATLSLDQIP